MNRKFISFRRVIKAGGVNFFRNFSLSVAATAVMVVTLTIVLFSIIANATFNHTIQGINDKIVVSVYLKDTVTNQQKDDLISQLKGLPNVASVNYASKEQALINYRKQNEGNVDLLLAISQTDNPLPATIQIKPRDPAKINDIKQLLETPEVLQQQSDKTSYSGDRKEAIDKISRATAFFKKAVFASVFTFAVISMLIIFNTIQMAIFNRRDELTIMRLLGASPWYIRGPFIVETMFYGVVSAIISITLCNLIFVVQSQAFDASSLGLLDLQYANQYFANHFWIFLALQLLAGMTIGAASALIATSRYLRQHSRTRPSLRRRKK